MNPLVSVCIPTRNRPDPLLEAVDSALRQTYRELEVIVSDDSDDDRSERALRRLGTGRVRYFRNTPPLGQSGNVNRLYSLAQGARLVLLHDDDVLLPDAVRALAACWEAAPDLSAAYGKQQVMTADGRVLPAESERLNTTYYRTAEYAGPQHSAQWAALVAQFPNDGYLVRTDAARATGYRSRSEVGDACDYDFGLRLAAGFPRFWFLCEDTARYRLSEESISRAGSSNIPLYSYLLLEALQLPPTLEATREARMRQHAPAAITKALRSGDSRLAWRIYTSRHHGWADRLSPRGLAQALLLASPPKLSMWALRQHRPD